MRVSYYSSQDEALWWFGIIVLFVLVTLVSWACMYAQRPRGEKKKTFMRWIWNHGLEFFDPPVAASTKITTITRKDLVIYGVVVPLALIIVGAAVIGGVELAT